MFRRAAALLAPARACRVVARVKRRRLERTASVNALLQLPFPANPGRPESLVLFIFPDQGAAQDQLRGANELSKTLPDMGCHVLLRYPQDARRSVRARPTSC